MLSKDNCVLIGIDFQEKLVGMLGTKEPALKFGKLLSAAKALDIPIIMTEQYPKGLGKTVFEISETIEKQAFSAMAGEEFKTALAQVAKKQIIIGGIETHICVHQTVEDLLNSGYEVYVVKDACASRKEFDHETGLELMKANGAKITCLEIVLFELLRTSKHPTFKEIQALIK